MMAVDTEASAVMTLIAPASQYWVCQGFQTSNRCVAPQATMKTPNSETSQPKGRSRRLRMNQRSVIGMVTSQEGKETSTLVHIGGGG